MNVFVTGATGYLGSYVTHELLQNTDAKLTLLVRAKDRDHAMERLWKGMQLHQSFEQFREHFGSRVDIALGDLHAPVLGFDAATERRVVTTTESVIHCAASLNRKSAKACFNTNLRGTLSLLKLARAMQDHHGLRRFTDVSTTAVSGVRSGEVVYEDRGIEWDRSDYDPYARTKKFCEHMLEELLPDVDHRVFRPATILGDSEKPETTQFDMVRAFVLFAPLPVAPFHPDWRMDIVPANYAGRAVATVHMKEKPAHRIYHLSSGTDSLTYRQIYEAMLPARRNGRMPVFAPRAEPAVGGIAKFVGGLRWRHPVAYGGALMKVFWPYMTFDTVFDNSRIVEEMGEAPASFADYCVELYRFATRNKLTYPHRPWPAGESVGGGELREVGT